MFTYSFSEQLITRCERGGRMNMITLDDLLNYTLVIVSLITLCYKLFKRK